MSQNTAPLTLLYCPFPSRESAREAARVLLEKRLVACCNLLPGSESHYWWEGALTESNEVVCIAKTTLALAPHAAEALLALHPYDCPAILRLTADANEAFAAWVGAATNL